MASWQRAGGEPKILLLAAKKLLENVFFVGKFSTKNATCGLKNPFWGNSGLTLKFLAPIISSVGNLQLSVGKLQLSAPPSFFLIHDAASTVFYSVLSSCPADDDDDDERMNFNVA